MRVIAGTAKGRKLAMVPGSGTRPISDKVKGAVFDILGGDVVGARFLDLYAGTGSVGIEALSRGAEHVVFVERARKAVATVEKNLEATGFWDRADVIRTDAFRFLNQADPDSPFDCIYVAPPQYRGLWAKTLLKLDEQPLLTLYGLVIVQIHPKEARDLALERLVLLQERQYGSTLLRFYALKESIDED